MFIESDVPGNEAQPTHLNFFFFRSETQIDGKASVRERNKFQQRKGAQSIYRLRRPNRCANPSQRLEKTAGPFWLLQQQIRRLSASRKSFPSADQYDKAKKREEPRPIQKGWPAEMMKKRKEKKEHPSSISSPWSCEFTEMNRRRPR